MFPEAKLGLEFTYVGLSRDPTPYEKGEFDIANKETSGLSFDDVAYAKHVPADEDRLDVFVVTGDS